jgi:hydroxymethylpyrimidine pyrophosphatase-like HAD family hydrolase
MIDLVVTDLDGTLWHTDAELRSEVSAAVAEVLGRGIPLLVATGRRVTSAREPLTRMGVAPPAVVLNGALGLDLATGRRFHRAPFPADQAGRALAAFRSVELEPVIYVDHDRYEVFVSGSPSTNPGHLASFGDGAGTDDLDRVVAEEVVLGFSLIGVPHGPLASAAEALDGFVETHLDRSLDYPGRASLTVAPKGQSKWEGVVAFCASRGLAADRVLAVADGPNDVELLEHASVRVVPDDAHPAVRGLADHVIESSRLGGWAAVPDLIR